MGSDAAEFVRGDVTFRVLSRVQGYGCDPQRIALSVKKYVDSWVGSPGLKFLVNPTRRLLLVLSVTVTDGLVECRLIDAVNFSNLNLTADPRRIPAQVGHMRFSAKWHPDWVPLFLLCVFDQLQTLGCESPGEYPLWGGRLVAKMEALEEEGHLRLMDIQGDSLEYLSGADL